MGEKLKSTLKESGEKSTESQLLVTPYPCPIQEEKFAAAKAAAGAAPSAAGEAPLFWRPIGVLLYHELVHHWSKIRLELS
jgi:hypothetical protein